MAVTYEAVPGGTTTYVTITASASANTKGSYTQLVASTGIAADGFYVIAVGANNNLSRLYLFDIATGGAGAETVIVPNLSLQEPGGAYSAFQWTAYVPMPIAAGTRIAARVQSSTGSSQLFLALLLVNGGGVLTAPLTSVVAATYGANTGTSGATAVDAGASANTKGAYAQLTAATSSTNNIKLLLVQIMPGANSALADAQFLIDIATGGAGSETVIVPNITVASVASGSKSSPNALMVPVDIATGTRIAARAASTTNDATDRVVQVSVTAFEGVFASGGGVSMSRVVNA